MEDGKPAYVVVPFDDYVENTKNAKGVSSGNEEGNNILDVIREEERNVIEDIVPAIESIFEEEMNIEEEQAEILKGINNIATGRRIPDGQKKDVREIRLEDLPF